jgi:hypothetical protein
MLSKGQPLVFPRLLVRKKMGKVHFCVKYRRIFDVTRKDCSPLLEINENLDMLAVVRRFSIFNLRSGY